MITAAERKRYRRVTLRTVEAAARWWADMLREPQDPLLREQAAAWPVDGVALIRSFAASLPRLTAEQIEKYRQELVARLPAELLRFNGMLDQNSRSIDDAAKAAGFDVHLRYADKTRMTCWPGEVRISLGYGGAYTRVVFCEPRCPGSGRRGIKRSPTVLDRKDWRRCAGRCATPQYAWFCGDGPLPEHSTLPVSWRDMFPALDRQVQRERDDAWRASQSTARVTIKRSENP